MATGGGPLAKRVRMSLGDPGLDLDDPNPDVWELFRTYNATYFQHRLNVVTVEWSQRLTSCAGLCYYKGRYGGCQIKLSVPLLSFRPRSDTENTLMHEMIHAYLFVTQGNTERDQDGHGPQFQALMHSINAKAGTNVTVYHSFHDEVEYHKKHWWRCDGACRQSGPYFGFVKRAMNRAPGPNDRWFAEHQRNCGGKFIKIKEPEKTVKAPKTGRKRKTATAAGEKSQSTSGTSGTSGGGGQKTLLDYYLKQTSEIIDLSSDDEDFQDQLKKAKIASKTEASCSATSATATATSSSASATSDKNDVMIPATAEEREALLAKYLESKEYSLAMEIMSKEVKKEKEPVEEEPPFVVVEQPKRKTAFSTPKTSKIESKFPGAGNQLGGAGAGSSRLLAGNLGGSLLGGTGGPVASRHGNTRH